MTVAINFNPTPFAPFTLYRRYPYTHERAKSAGKMGAVQRSFLDFFETLSRVVLYVSAFIYIFPVLEYRVHGTGLMLLVQWLLQLSRYFTLLLLLLNVPLTTYAPFGKTVLCRHAFLTRITAIPSYFIISMLSLALLTITRQDEVDFVFSNISQTEAFNLTAYLAGATEFFVVQDTSFGDELDTLVEFAFTYAQQGLFYGSIVFTAASSMTSNEEEERFTEAEEWAMSWYTRTWQERPETLGALGLARRGPLLRNITLLLFSGLAFLLNLVDYFSASTGTAYNAFLIFLAEMAFAAILFAYSLRKVLLNLRQNRQGSQGAVVYPVYLLDIYFVLQLHFYVAATSPTLALIDANAGTIYAAAGPALILIVWVITFNRRFLAVVVWSVLDVNRIVIVNLREPQRFYRLFSSVAISAGIAAVFFSYYAYVGNAFEFEFASGNAVDAVSDVLDDVESVFDDTIRAINAFLLVVTPCSTTSDFWKNASSVGLSGGVVTAAATLAELRSNEYYDVCFVGNGSGTGAELQRPPAQTCEVAVSNYDALVAQEAAAANVRANEVPGGLRDDADFVDDDGQPPDPDLQVLTIDRDCAEKLCTAFTVLTTALFAATLIPFVNIGAAAASKAARVAWRISRMGRRLLKRARKLYAKRRKLFRFTKLVKRLAAVGNPVLRFNTAILILFIPVALVGLLCMLLGFFRRPRGLPPLSANARARVLFVFTALTLFNFALFVGLFGLGTGGDNSLRFVRNTLGKLPPLVIRSEVRYGSGILYLRLCLLVSMASSAAMAVSISASFCLDRAVALRDYVSRQTRQSRGQSRSRGRYKKIERNPFLETQAETKTTLRTESTRAPLNYAVLVVFLVVPVCFFAAQSFNNPDVRWFRLVALQDDRMADVAEQIASAEVVQDATDIINDDTNENERACGLVAVAAEAVFEVLLTLLHDAVAPLLDMLNALRQFSTELLGQVRVGSLFAPIDLNLPMADNSEFWIVFALPLAVVAIGIAAIIADLVLSWKPSLHNGKLEFFLESVKGIILALGLAAFQIDLVIYSVFSSLSGLDVPLFNVEVELGDMLVFSLYSSVTCVATGVVMYMYELLL